MFSLTSKKKNKSNIVTGKKNYTVVKEFMAKQKHET